MGANYYWYEKPACPTCGREFDGLHIGKSSFGWKFSLHIIPEEDINELADWKEKFRTGHILNEYGDAVSTYKMIQIITKRKDYIAPSLEKLKDHNHRYCRGPGKEGDYDLITGEFS